MFPEAVVRFPMVALPPLPFTVPAERLMLPVPLAVIVLAVLLNVMFPLVLVIDRLTFGCKTRFPLAGAAAKLLKTMSFVAVIAMLLSWAIKLPVEIVPVCPATIVGSVASRVPEFAAASVIVTSIGSRSQVPIKPLGALVFTLPKVYRFCSALVSTNPPLPVSPPLASIVPAKRVFPWEKMWMSPPFELVPCPFAWMTLLGARTVACVESRVIEPAFWFVAPLA